MHGGLERFAQLARIDLHADGCRVIAPGTLVVADRLALRAVVVVPGRELGDVVADVRQRLHLGGHAQPSGRIVAPIQRHHADRIARDQDAPGGAVPQGEGEDAVEAVQPVTDVRVLAEQRADDLAVRLGLEVVRLRQRRLQLAVVVDLPVDGQHEVAVGGTHRLRTTGRIDDRQTLVDEDRGLIDIHPAPVRTAVALAPGQR